jgi:hypothetical protein
MLEKVLIDVDNQFHLLFVGYVRMSGKLCAINRNCCKKSPGLSGIPHIYVI